MLRSSYYQDTKGDDHLRVLVDDVPAFVVPPRRRDTAESAKSAKGNAADVAW
jgi:hypothetical protein